MLKHRLGLLALTLVLVTAPVSHRVLASSATAHGWPCPYEERARLAAAGYDAMPVLIQGDPAEGSLFDPGRRSASLFAP
jgi:hypothetical protein